MNRQPPAEHRTFYGIDGRELVASKTASAPGPAFFLRAARPLRSHPAMPGGLHAYFVFARSQINFIKNFTFCTLSLSIIKPQGSP